MGIIYYLALLTILPQIMAGKPELNAVIKGNSLFTNKLYSVLAEEPGNVFFSPISAHAVLAMAYQGSQGTTHEAFGKVLGFSSHLQAAEGYSDVLANLNNIPNVELLMGNKIYVQQGRTLKPSFQEITAKKFLSEVQALDFKNNQVSAKIINTWVEEKTKNKIQDLIAPDSLGEDTRLVLVNAIYFKGNWASKFNKNLTATEKFYLNDNDSIDVQMMNNKGKYFYKEDAALDAKVLELPYTNPDVSLIVILPNERNGIAKLEEKLAHIDLSRITENMHKPEVVVKLPKFKIEATVKLNNVLQKIGLGVIFGREANFTEMLTNPEPLAVSEVIQKAFIEVNEEGTEAAAATAAIFFARTQPRIIVEHVTVDHPCILMVRSDVKINKDSRVSNVLFLGKLETGEAFTH